MRSLLLLLFFCSASFSAFAAKTPSEADLKQLKSHISQAQKRLAQSQGQSNQLEQSLKQQELELAQLEKQINQLNQSLKTHQQQLNVLLDEEKTLNTQVIAQQKILEEQILLHYRLGRESTIKLLLNQENPQQLSRMRSYAEYFNRARVDALLQYQQTQQAISQNQLALQSQSQLILQEKNRLGQTQIQLKKNHQQRSQTLVALKADIKTDQQKINRLQQEQLQLEALLRSVNEAISNIRLPSDSVAFAKQKGRLLWPTKGKLTHTFGKARGTGDLQYEGLTIAANAGQPVHAIAHGRVVFADWFRGKGLLLIIDHGDGYMSLYAHNQTLVKETGDWVSAGENIATVGNSGGMPNNELYFEIRHQGKPINPAFWLSKG